MNASNRDDPLRRLLRLWSGKHRGGALPAHADLRPDELMFMLPDVCLVNVAPDGGYRFRLVGTGVADRLRHDPTGKGFGTLAPATATELGELCAATLDAGRPMLATGRLQFGAADQVVEALCLPLADAGGEITVLLLGFHFRAWRDVAAVPPPGELEICDVETARVPETPPGIYLKVAC
jgi:hypothetical protein